MKILWFLAIVVIFPLASFGSSGPKDANGKIMHLSNLKEGSYKVGASSSDTRDYSLESEKNPAVAFVLSFLLRTAFIMEWRLALASPQTIFL